MARGTTPGRGALWKRVRRGCVALLALAAAAGLPVHAAAVDRRLVEAAYVLNFLRFSDWPGETDADDPWRVVVIGPREAAQALRSIAAEAEAAGTLPRPLRVVHLADAGSDGASAARVARSLQDAHAVFVAEPEHRLTPLVVAEASRRPLLSIGIGAGFAHSGGMLALVEVGGRLGFTCNEAAVLRSPVRVSAKVLRIARPLEPSSALGAPPRWLLAGGAATAGALPAPVG